jgi:hypothetical protein
MQEAVGNTLGTCDSGEKYKYDMVFTYAKNKLTEYRTEERRKVWQCHGLCPTHFNSYSLIAGCRSSSV